MQTNKLFLGCSFLFTLTAFLLIIISMAGSSANYKPLTNIYIGQADISHINITKVIPQLGALPSMLASLILTYPNETETIFTTLESVAQTDALLPFLTIVIDSTNTTTTLKAIDALSPLALTTTNGSASYNSLYDINELLQTSKNTNQTVKGLSSLVSSQSNSNTSSTEALLQSIVFEVLETSKNATMTIEALLDITSISITDLMTLLPALELVEYSSNVTATFESLITLMNANISTDLTTQLFTLLNSSLSSSSNITSVFSSISSLVPSTMSSALEAVETLFTSSTNVTETFTLLESVVSSNLTSSSVAKQVMGDIEIILEEATNLNLLSTIVQTLMSSLSSISLTSSSLTMLNSAITELDELDVVLSAANNSTASVAIIDSLETILTDNANMTEYVPYIFEFLSSSSHPDASFEALFNITKLGSTDADIISSLLKVVSLAASTNPVTDQDLYDIYPTILERLQIPVKIMLAIFTLCKANLSGEIQTCSKSHAVQNFDFRAIIYQILMESGFEPYLAALNLKADDLHLDGTLQGKEKQYVPAVKAALSMNILSIVTGFFLMIAIVYIAVTRCLTTHWRWFTYTFTTMSYCAFTGLGTTVITAMVNIIKSGTAKDKYNVTVTSNAPFLGMTWCAFSLSVIIMFMTMYGWWSFYKQNRHGINANDTEVIVESTSDSVSDDSQIIKEEVVQEDIKAETNST